MKTEDYKKVKVGTLVIYAHQDVGVKRARVSEINIKVEEQQPTYHYAYPYGCTAKCPRDAPEGTPEFTGIVRIKYDETEVIEDLANLVRHRTTYYTRLLKEYEEWQEYKAAAATYKEVFLSSIQELKVK